MIDLTDLSATSGFKIIGAAANDEAGRSVSSAGDVNGDGFADLLIGAAENDPLGRSGSGAVYVVFGKPTGFDTIDLASLSGTDGFKIVGEEWYDRAGTSVSSAGDFNRDGFADIIVGARYNDTSGNGDSSALYGAAYVVFGKADGFGTIDLASLDATTGFKIAGEARRDQAGANVSSAGDVNGDGFADVIVSALQNDPSGRTDGGAAYVVFGKATGFATLDLASLPGSDGFKIIGEAESDFAGSGVSSAGDVNGDGFDDVLVGAWRNDPSGRIDAGAAYVVFGKASGWGTVDLASLDAATGFKITGEAADDLAGISVSSAGDVNGDGFADIIVSASHNASFGRNNAGAAYVVFGKASGLGTVDLASLSGTDGFKIAGEAFGDFAGDSVSSAGDVNGDGFADILVGGGSVGSPESASRDYTGAAYVVFGKADGFDTVDLAALTAATGLKIAGEAPYDFTGRSVSSAGDVNGDGFDDILVGAHGSDPAGRNGAGAAYVIFGHASGNAPVNTVPGAQSLMEDGSLTLTSIRVTNVSNFAALTVTLSVMNGSLALASTSGLTFSDEQGDATATFSGTESAINAALAAGLTYTPTANYHGDDTLTVTSSVENNGGILSDQDAVALTVTAISLPVTVNGVTYIDRSYIQPTGDGATSIVVKDSTTITPIGIVGNDSSQFLQGNAGPNDLSGNGGDDTLDGLGGADFMRGGEGDDLFIVDSADDVVFEDWNGGLGGIDTVQASVSYTLGRFVENLTLTGSADIDGTGNDWRNTIRGNEGNNVLFGGASIDALYGGAGDDTLDGGAGVDWMWGGDGDDLYIVDDPRDVIMEDYDDQSRLPSPGVDTVLASVSYSLSRNVENLTLTGSADIDGTGNLMSNIIRGNDGRNTLSGGAAYDTLYGGGDDDVLDGGSERDALYGEAGDDRLDGGTGADWMWGGDGDDLYIVDDAGDIVTEDWNGGQGGTDTVQASISYALGWNVEDLVLTGSAEIDGTGNGSNNLMRGNDGNNILAGGGAYDTLYGGAGSDRLEGGSERDKLYGETGDDTLDGGSGADWLWGGAGNDRFVFRSAAEADGDRLMDFNRGDKLDLSGIDAVQAADGDQAFEFIGDSEFSGVAGELRFEVADTGSQLSGDANGDGVADFTIFLMALRIPVATDFIL